MKIFAERLIELRKSKGISHENLASAIGVTRTAISHWEKNKVEIIAQHVVKLADFFGVTTDYLLGREN